MYDSRELEREIRMGRFIEGADRTQATLLPETIDDYVCEEILGVPKLLEAI
jgi:hypothetical protein